MAITTAVTVTATSLAGGVPIASSAKASDPSVAMRPERILGAPSKPALAPWGVEYDAVSRDLLVSDYDSDQVRMFSLQGTFLGDVGAGGIKDGPPGGIAVDPRDGSFYVDVWATDHSVIRKYTANGTFLYEIDSLNDGAWITVDSNGTLWIPDLNGGDEIHGLVMGATTPTYTQIASLTVNGAKFFGGIDTDSAGNIYVDDQDTHSVYSLTQSGQIRWEVVNPTLFPGDLRGVGVNKVTGNVYIGNVGSGTIDVLDPDGNLQSSFGGSGSAPGQFVSGPRGVAFDPSGDVYVADFGGSRMEEFSSTGAYLSMFPGPGTGPDPLGLDEPYGVAVNRTTGNVYVADTYNQRILEEASDGTLITSFGQRGSNPANSVNYPESVAVDQSTGDVWVSNHQEAPDLVEYDPGLHKVLSKIATPHWVNGLAVANGLVYTTPFASLNVYSEATGQLVDQYSGYFNSVGVDPVTGDVWVTADNEPDVFVLSPSLELLRSISLPTVGWGVAFYAGQAYVAVQGSGEIAVYDSSTFAEIGTFGSVGSGFGQLDRPANIDIDSTGDLYVTETGNDRVQVFSPSPASPEGAGPAVSVSSSVVVPEIVVTGTATSSSAIALVQIEVTDTTSGLTYEAKSNSYGAKAWSPAVYWGPSTSVDWRFTVPLTAASDSYRVSVRAQDIYGNTSQTVTAAVS